MHFSGSTKIKSLQFETKISGNFKIIIFSCSIKKGHHLMKIRKVTILGSTGSIGINALKVIENLKEEIRVIGLSCNKNIDLLINQIKTLQPSLCINC